MLDSIVHFKKWGQHVEILPGSTGPTKWGRGQKWGQLEVEIFNKKYFHDTPHRSFPRIPSGFLYNLLIGEKERTLWSAHKIQKVQINKHMPSLFLTKADKLNMPYLRGNKKQSKYRRPTLEEKLAYLERRINANTRAKANLHQNYTMTSAGVGYQLHTLNVTTDTINDALFRPIVNGDRFVNHYLRVNVVAHTNASIARVLVYSPSKPNTSFVPATSALGLCTNPDFEAFRVLKDTVINKPTSTSTKMHQIYVPLRNMVSIYNWSSGVLEKGEIKIMVLYHAAAGSVTCVEARTEHVFSDK